MNAPLAVTRHEPNGQSQELTHTKPTGLDKSAVISPSAVIGAEFLKLQQQDPKADYIDFVHSKGFSFNKTDSEGIRKGLPPMPDVMRKKAYDEITDKAAEKAQQPVVAQTLKSLQDQITELKQQLHPKGADVSTAAPADTHAIVSTPVHAATPSSVVTPVQASLPTTKVADANGTVNGKIYGSARLEAASVNDGDVSHTTVQNVNSRIGVRADFQVEPGLSSFVQIEQTIAPDDSKNSGALANRNSIVGLKDETYGTLALGKYEMPFKVLEGTAVPMFGNADERDLILNGKGSELGLGKTAFNLANRQTNVAQYWSPEILHTKVKLAYSPDEVNGAPGTVKTNVLGGSVEYNDGTWNAGLAYEKQENKNGLGHDLIGEKATVGWKSDTVTLGAAYSNIDNGLGKETDNVVLAGTYKMGQTTLKASYGQSSETAPGANDGIKTAGVEADYKLGKNTTVYGYAAKILNDDQSKARFVEASDPYPTASGKDPVTIGAGIKIDF